MTAVELETGVFSLTDEQYFAPELARATLSASGAKVLLKPGGPARFHHQRETGTIEIKREFDLGHAVHTLVLGSGPEQEVRALTEVLEARWPEAYAAVVTEKTHQQIRIAGDFRQTPGGSK